MGKSKADKVLTRQFMLSMLVFLLFIAAQAFSLELLDMPVWMQVVITLAPVIPLVWAFFIFRARYQGLDEYLKALTGESFLWLLGIICFASFAYGMLAMKFDMPEINLAFVLPAVLGGHELVLRLLLWRDNEE